MVHQKKSEICAPSTCVHSTGSPAAGSPAAGSPDSCKISLMNTHTSSAN